MKKKIFSLLLVSVMAAGLLAGCGSSSDSSDTSTTEESSESSGDVTTITITFRDEGDGEDGGLYKWFAESYETYEKKDEIELDIQYITASEGDYFAKVELALADESTAPDIVCEDTFYLPSDVAAGYLTDLTDYLAEWEEWNDGTIYDSLKEAAAYGDSTYGVPYNTDTRALMYNRSVLEEAGVIAEGEDWAPTCWDDILDACALIQANTDCTYPFWCNAGTVSGEATSMQTYEMLLYGTGEELTDDDGNWILTSQAILDTLTFLETMFEEGYASEDLIYDSEASNNAMDNYLPTGDVAIALNGVWCLGDYKEDGSAPWDNYDTELGIAAMPTQYGDGDGYITMTGGWVLSIPEYSDAKDEAWDFIVWCMDYDNYKSQIDDTGNMTVRSDLAEDEDYASSPHIDEFTALAEYAYYRPHTDEYSTVTTYIYTMVEQVVSMSLTPEEAMEEYATSVISALETTYGTADYVENY